MNQKVPLKYKIGYRMYRFETAVNKLVYYVVYNIARIYVQKIYYGNKEDIKNLVCEIITIITIGNQGVYGVNYLYNLYLQDNTIIYLYGSLLSVICIYGYLIYIVWKSKK
jgi:hypothetical protein